MAAQKRQVEDVHKTGEQRGRGNKEEGKINDSINIPADNVGQAGGRTPDW